MPFPKIPLRPRLPPQTATEEDTRMNSDRSSFDRTRWLRRGALILALSAVAGLALRAYL